MSQNAEVVPLQPEREPALAPGLHLGRIEAVLDEPAGAVVRIEGGPKIDAGLHSSLEPEFVDECCRDSRVVLLTAAADGKATIMGALQTARAVSRDAQGTVRLEGDRVEIAAPEGLSFKVGKATLRLDANGTFKLVGQRLSMDMATVVRIMSSLVELP